MMARSSDLKFFWRTIKQFFQKLGLDGLKFIYERLIAAFGNFH